MIGEGGQRRGGDRWRSDCCGLQRVGAAMGNGGDRLQPRPARVATGEGGVWQLRRQAGMATGGGGDWRGRRLAGQ